MAHPPPPVIGELVVVALKAEKLQHQSQQKQDPFCLFRVGDVIKRTKIDVGGGQYPIWDDQVNIPIAAGYHQMQVTIFNKDTNPNNVMGEGMVDLQKVLRETEHDGYFPISFRGRPGTGELYLELTFYPAQNNAAMQRPQQQVRYQYPPGYIPGGNRPPPPPQQQHGHPPPPSQHHSSRPPPPQMHPPHQNGSRPPPTQHQYSNRPLPQQQPHMPQPQQHFKPQHSTYPPQPRPSNSMKSSHFSAAMPSPQPLLSAPYNPVPSPASRPANLNYPPPNPQYGNASYPPTGPPGGFRDPTYHHHPQQQRPPPPQQPIGYPPQRVRPMPPGGFAPRPNHGGGYPPY